MRTRITRLAALDLFADCTRRQLEFIDRVSMPLAVPRGKVICRQGDTGLEAFVVVDGVAAVTIDGVLVNTIGRGELIGEIACFMRGVSRTASVVTETDMSVLVFTRAEFRSMLYTVEPVANKVYRIVAQRLLANASTAVTNPDACVGSRDHAYG